MPLVLVKPGKAEQLMESGKEKGLRKPSAKIPTKGSEIVKNASSPKPTDAVVDESLVQQREHELASIREDLQSSIEELESSNEQLKASNEEVMSMNEELQSANEELETSKEELQSLNEELGTVNSQLHDKVEELERSTNDLANLLTCTDIATVFLDPQMRILRFTPATKLLAVSELRVRNLRLFTGVMRDISDRRELERQVLEIAAEEQVRIGQDLHDSVGQELTGLGLVADTLVGCFEKSLPP